MPASTSSSASSSSSPCVALEVDGPHHFARNVRGVGARRPLGRTLLKRRLLARGGKYAAVAHVHYLAWNALRGARSRRAYLRAKLFAGGLARASDGFDYYLDGL